MPCSEGPKIFPGKLCLRRPCAPGEIWRLVCLACSSFAVVAILPQSRSLCGCRFSAFRLVLLSPRWFLPHWAAPLNRSGNVITNDLKHLPHPSLSVDVTSDRVPIGSWREHFKPPFGSACKRPELLRNAYAIIQREGFLDTHCAFSLRVSSHELLARQHFIMAVEHLTWQDGAQLPKTLAFPLTSPTI